MLWFRRNRFCGSYRRLISAWRLLALPRPAADPLHGLVLRVRAYIEQTQDPVFQQIMFTDAPAAPTDAARSDRLQAATDSAAELMEGLRIR
jgi:hypothetical protein